MVLRSLVVLLVLVQPLSGHSPQGKAFLEAAAGAERSGRYDEAATLYQQYLSQASLIDPSTLIQVRTRLATAYFLLHRYQQSLDAVQPVTSSLSSKSSGSRIPAQAWLVDGLDRLELQQLPQAMLSLRQALKLNPESGTARLALGDSLARSGRLEEAAREYEDQIRRTPSQPDAWYKLGLAHAQLTGRITEDFVRQLPNSAIGRQMAAEDLLTRGDDRGASKSLSRLLHDYPEQLQVHADLGEALLELGYPQAADDQFHRELSHDPYCPLARLGAAETATLRGDWDQVAANLKEVVRSNPLTLAKLLELRPPGGLRDAWRNSKLRVPRSFSDTDLGKLWESWLSGSQSIVIPADTVSHPVCSKLPSNRAMQPGFWLPESCYRDLRNELNVKALVSRDERVKLAEAEFRLGNHQDTYRESKKLLEQHPRDEWGLYWLGKANDELAQDCFSRLTSLEPDSARVHQMLGEYYRRRNNLPRAKMEYTAAIRLAPELADLHLALGSVYWADGEWSEAERELKKTLELTPASTVAEYELGDTYFQQRRWQLAADHLRRVLGVAGLDAKARLDLAQAEAQMGQTRRAVEELLPAAKQDQQGQIHYQLALLYRKLGDKLREKHELAIFRQLQIASADVDQNGMEATAEHPQRTPPAVQ